MTYGTYNPNIPRPTYSSIIGKPETTVSSKGRSNGLSTKINDGADFGPDTTLNATSPSQTGPPYTQTSGIQEAFNYSATSTLYSIDTGHLFYPIKFLNGNFKIFQPITFGIGNYPSTDSFGVSITGSGLMNSAITWVGSTAPTSMITINTNINNIYIADFDIDNIPSSGSGPNYGLYWVSTKNGTSNAFIMKNINCGTDFATDMFYIGNAFLVYLSDIIIPNTNVEIYGNGSSGSMFILNGGKWGGNQIITNKFETTDIFGVSANTLFIPPNGGGYTPSTVSVHSSKLGIYITTNIHSLSIEDSIISSNSTTIGAIQTQSDIDMLSVKQSIISGALLSNPTTTTVTIGSLIVDGLMNNGTVGPLLGQNASYITVDNYSLKNINSGTFSGTLPVNTPTTPTVPTSGTAQQNTNPYSVNVYLYGGTVTEIQLTRNGTAYTVFSNASGLALSGQVYKLNPSDSITITYTTAPTWEWLAD